MPILEYNDKAHKIYFNTTADLSSLPLGTQNMLRYINDGVVNDDTTKTIDEAVIKARLIEEWRSEYMLTLVHDNDVFCEGKEEGLAQGIAQGVAQGITQGITQGSLTTLSDLIARGAITIEIAAEQAGMTVEELENRIKTLV